MRTFLLRPLILAAAAVCAAAAEPVRVGHVEVELVPERAVIEPGKSFTVGLRMRMDEHWHTYWVNPGDSGMPTTVEWTLPEGFSAGPLQWPAPQRIPTPPLMTYGYEGEILLLTDISVPVDLPTGRAFPIRARVEWLVCKESCIPGEAVLSLTLPAGPRMAPPQPRIAAMFLEARRRLPEPSPSGWEASFVRSATAVQVDIKPPAATELNPAQVYFFPLAEGVFESAAPQAPKLADGVLSLQLPLVNGAAAGPAEIRGVLVTDAAADPGDAGRAVELVATREGGPAAGATGGSLPVTLGLAFLGGLVLNLMPCVFPVLGIKILGFVHQAGADRKKVTLHGLAFTVGVLLSFWTLALVLIALRTGGEQLGWGFQLQSPGFVFALAVFLLVFALNLSGVFEVGLSAVGVGSGLQARSGLGGSFFTGVLATVVATPCSAPFLAPALGAALTLTPAASMAVFTAIAVGLSSPYLLLSVFPALIRFLPRPGAWMEAFKQLMAFPLYATVGFLVWVLAGQVDEGALLRVVLGFVLVAMAVWVYGRWVQHGGSTARRALSGAVAGLLLVGGIAFGVPSRSGLDWQEWSPGAAESLRASGRVVYVDFTARWCATCQSNKALVFSSDAVQESLRRHNVVLLKADWTNRDPEITRALASFGRSAVPVNLIYAPGRPEPVLLPEVLTPGLVLEALETAVAARTSDASS